MSGGEDMAQWITMKDQMRDLLREYTLGAGFQVRELCLLLLCVFLSFVVVVLALMLKNSLRKNDSLHELLHHESDRHTGVVLSLSDRLNTQYYMHQEKVSIEHIATLRELLSSFSPAPNPRPEAVVSERPVDSSE